MLYRVATHRWSTTEVQSQTGDLEDMSSELPSGSMFLLELFQTPMLPVPDAVPAGLFDSGRVQK